MCWSLRFLAWILLYLKGAWCLRMVSLQIPSRAVVGDTIRLSCRFELEGDTLYSIKWYREDVEFFRFVPRDRPPGQYFSMHGVRVDEINSANNSVILEGIDLNTTGTYKCEVSADAPSFQTEFTKKQLTVKEYDDSSSSHLHYGFLSTFCLLLTTFFW